MNGDGDGGRDLVALIVGRRLVRDGLGEFPKLIRTARPALAVYTWIPFDESLPSDAAPLFRRCITALLSGCAHVRGWRENRKQARLCRYLAVHVRTNLTAFE